jgi:hypothetical protein
LVRLGAKLKTVRYTASGLIGFALLLAIGLTWAADPPTLDELATAIDKLRAGPDGERVVLGHISRKVGVSVETLRAQQAQTKLGWGELFIANLLCSKTPKLTVVQVTAEFRSGVGWTDIAHHHNVRLDQLIAEVQQSQQAMEQRTEDRAPPPTHTAPQPSQGTTAPTLPFQTFGGTGGRY